MTRIRVSTGLGCTNCAVQTDDGRILRGARVSSDYVRAGESEGVYEGRCVRTVHRDRKSGNVVFDDDVQLTEMVNGTLKWATSDDLVLEVHDTEPPPLAGRRR
jgi:hypothetical protein